MIPAERYILGSKPRFHTKKEVLTRDVVIQLLDYNPDTGIFTHKERAIETFAKPSAGKIWNSRFPGTVAFNSNRKGYKVGSLLGYDCYAHHIAWLITHGSWPECQIDHINGVRSDNRICNLRDVSQSDNNRNRRLLRSNSSGCLGVHWSSADQRWVARVQVGGKRVCLGYFKDYEEAVKVRKEAEVNSGYHKNHGDRVPLGCD